MASNNNMQCLFCKIELSESSKVVLNLRTRTPAPDHSAVPVEESAGDDIVLCARCFSKLKRDNNLHKGCGGAKKGAGKEPKPNSADNTQQRRESSGMSGTARSLAIWGGALLGGVATVAAAPFVIGAMGFGAGGIVAGSAAASMMSSAWTTGIGVGAVSFLQSAGAVGLGAGATAVVAGAGAAAGAAAGAGVAKVVEVATEDKKDEDDKKMSMK